MTPNANLVHGDVPYKGSGKVILGNGKSLTISHVGHAFLNLPKCTLKLSRVFLVPLLTKNLLSIVDLV